MIAATQILKPGPARIGELGGGIKLPRTVTVKKLAAVSAGAFVGVVFGLAAIGGLRGILYGAALGGTGGGVAATWSPLEGETMSRWLLLSINSQRKRVTWEGKPAKISIGICPISTPARGRVVLRAGAVKVPSHLYDERGVLIDQQHRNTDRALPTPTLRSRRGFGPARPAGSPDAEGSEQVTVAPPGQARPVGMFSSQRPADHHP